MKSLKIGVLLPHTLLYGGVKRFLELGNQFIKLGHSVFIFTPCGQEPDWYQFNGQVLPMYQLKEIELDALFFTEMRFIDTMVNVNVKNKIFYFVRANENLRKVKKIKDVIFFANSINLVRLAQKKYGIDAFAAIGGIDLEKYKPKKISLALQEPLRVLVYGRLAERRKGTMFVVRACERLYKKGVNIHLTLFDTPQNDEMREAIKKFKTIVPYTFILNHPVDRNHEIYYSADIFVAPEKKAGWANTVIEAIACGVPVLASESGTNDFLFHLETGYVITRNSRKICKAIEYIVNNPEQRVAMAKKARERIEKYSWKQLSKRIIDYLSKLN